MKNVDPARHVTRTYGAAGQGARLCLRGVLDRSEQPALQRATLTPLTRPAWTVFSERSCEAGTHDTQAETQSLRL